MNLAEELLLCAIDDKGNVASSHKIAAGIGGALLAELALAGRIRIDDGTLELTDATLQRKAAEQRGAAFAAGEGTTPAVVDAIRASQVATANLAG